MDDKIGDNVNKLINLDIDCEAYLVNTSLNLNDFLFLSECLDDVDDNYCFALARIIRKNIISEDTNKPSAEQICSQGDQMFSAYIDATLQTNEDLCSFYDKREDEKDRCRRFILSIEDALKDVIAPIIEGLSGIWGQINLPQIPIDSFADWTDSISKHLTPVTESIQKWADVLDKASFKISSEISSSLKHLIDFSSILSNVFDDFSKQIGNLLAEIDIPSISEDEKELLRISHRVWGEYGWTVIPNAPEALYDSSPTSPKEANKIALAYCGDKSLDRLFAQLKDAKRAKKSDLEEAICCFKNRNYRACCLVLFSLIDSKLIRAQKNEDRKRNGFRETGSNAFTNIKKRIDNNEAIGVDTLLWLLSFETMFSCINSFFKNGKDFVHQPLVINRHFISHGMMIREVKRKDSVQLFLLYFNLLKFLDIYYDVSRR